MRNYYPYPIIKELLARNQAFTGHTLTAKTLQHGSVCECGGAYYYKVLSYKTVLYAECMKCNRYWFNRAHYSPTTSKHQNLIRQLKGIKV